LSDCSVNRVNNKQTKAFNCWSIH